MIISRVHPRCCNWHYFILVNGWVIFHCVYLYIYTCHIFFIHSSVNGHLGCFHVLVIVNSAAANIGVHVSFWTMVFSGYMPRSGIAGSHGSSIFCFKVHLDGKSTILFNFETSCSTTWQHKDAYPSSADLILIWPCSRHWAMYLMYIISFFNELILNILFWNNFKFTEECQWSYQELSCTCHPSSWVFTHFQRAPHLCCVSCMLPPPLCTQTYVNPLWTIWENSADVMPLY